MNQSFKPTNYNSLSPYLIVAGAQRLADLLHQVFGATVLRKFDHPGGTIAHMELQLDDSVLMLSDATEAYPPRSTMLHMYVPDVFRIFDLAQANGCEIIEVPVNRDGDPDTRGTFKDFAGNYWTVSTQAG